MGVAGPPVSLGAYLAGVVLPGPEGVSWHRPHRTWPADSPVKPALLPL